MRYIDIVDSFRGKKILVVGDLILDHYIWGKVRRISPEAPVPVVEVTRESHLLGGAANVAHNIASLGGRASVIGVCGNDSAGKRIRRFLREQRIDCTDLMTTDRPTTVKTRVIAHSQQVVRFDREDSSYVEGEILLAMLGRLRKAVAAHDAVIISDYKKGMVSPDLIRKINDAARSVSRKGGRRLFTAVDPKVGHFDYYRNVSLITPNVMEASSGSGIEINDEESLLRAGRALRRKLGCESVLITRGEDGMSLFEAKKVTHIPTVSRKVYDVTGAGDTVIAAFTLARASGAGMEEAAVIANHAAGIVVAEVGTAVASAEKLISSFEAS